MENVRKFDAPTQKNLALYAEVFGNTVLKNN